ncbi:hypothetical protein ES703_65542 [subsurface metagenome]
MGDFLGFSDLSTSLIIHPSLPVLSAIWALAEEYKTSGKNIIVAHVIGVEVSCKISSAVMPQLHVAGWLPCAVLGVFGATAAAGKILGLDEEQMTNALGIAGMEASGIRVAMGTMSKSYGRGRAGENAVVAATLAQMGFTGPTNVLEGKDGFLQTFSGGMSGDKIINSLGNPYTFVSPGITLKPFPSCTCSHTSIDAALTLRNEHKFSSEEIESVECSVSPAVASMMKFSFPENPLEAKYSLEFCVASALVDGKVTISSFFPERLKEHKIIDTMKKIGKRVSPELEKLGYAPESAPFGSEVRIRLKDGREYRCIKELGPWEPKGRPSRDELISKYRECANVLKPSEIDETVNIILNLETTKDICQIMDIVRVYPENGEKTSGYYERGYEPSK